MILAVQKYKVKHVGKKGRKTTDLSWVNATDIWEKIELL